MKIKRIIEVRDTREWIEEGDRWIALSGTGDARECDRCGRDHEVHATVELEDGTEAVVGTGCMKGDEFERELKSGATRAKTTRRLECELAAARERLAVVDQLKREVYDLDAPREEITFEPFGDHESIKWAMGDVYVISTRNTWNREQVEFYQKRTPATHWKLLQAVAGDERWSCLLDTWRTKRLTEKGWHWSDQRLETRIAELEKKIAKRKA